MNITETVTRTAVKFGEFWSCCARNDVQYAGAFDSETGTVEWHGLCDSCAHTYARTVRGAVVATIIDEIGVGDIVRHRGHNGKFTVTDILPGNVITARHEYYQGHAGRALYVTQAMLSDGEYIPNWTVVLSLTEARAMRDLYPADNPAAPF